MSGKQCDIVFTASFKFSYQKSTVEGNLYYFTKIVGKGTDKQQGSFTVSGECSEKAPYPCTVNLKFANGTSMECSGWREGDKGIIFEFLRL